MQNPDIPYLLIPGTDEERFEFDAPMLTIGRHDFTDVKIPDESISRRHCRFYRVGNTFWVQDWYSTGGIAYKGSRVTGVQGLLSGEGVSQAVRVGEFDVHVQCPAAFESDPIGDLDLLEKQFESLDNDFPEYVLAFEEWATAMRNEFGG